MLRTLEVHAAGLRLHGVPHPGSLLLPLVVWLPVCIGVLTNQALAALGRLGKMLESTDSFKVTYPEHNTDVNDCYEQMCDLMPYRFRLRVQSSPTRLPSSWSLRGSRVVR